MSPVRSLARNTTLNLLGQVVPFAAAFLSLPLLIQGLGDARFGVLTLAWLLIGYLSLFDLGLGQAITQMVARRLATHGWDAEASVLVWTATTMVLLLGAVGGALMAIAAPWAVHSALNVPPELRSETLLALYLLAASLPFVVATAALKGVLEAEQRFGLMNALRVPMGLLSYVGPLAVLPFSRSMPAVVAVLLVGRVLASVAHMVACLRVIPALRTRPSFDPALVGPLLRFGGWTTVSNVVGPLLSYSDRFLVSGMISVAALTYYATPYEAVTKLWMISGALASATFPLLVRSYTEDRGRAASLLDQGLRTMLVGLFPPVLVVVCLAPEGLQLWLGGDFGARSASVAQWLVAGVFVNSFAQLLYALTIGAGRPDLTAKLHLVEVPVYLAVLYWMTRWLGLEGAAIAWTFRMLMDAGLLLFINHRLLAGSVVVRGAALRIGGALAVLLLAGMVDELRLRLLVLVAGLAVFAVVAWLRIMREEERVRVRALLRGVGAWGVRARVLPDTGD